MTPLLINSPTTIPSSLEVSDLRARFEAIRQAVIEETMDSAELDGLHPEQRAGAANLAHYLALRQFDLRSLQSDLARLGLSSLGRAEGHVLATLNAIATVLAKLDDAPQPVLVAAPTNFDEGRKQLEAAANRLLGPVPEGRDARIMVTMPSEAATDPGLITALIASGMDIARINAAHDGLTAWKAMVREIRAAAATTGKPCQVIVDLPGPKLRTGPIEQGPQVLKIRPQRDALGEVTSPGILLLMAAGDDSAIPPAGIPVIPVDPDWLEKLKHGSRISLRDARGKRRVFEIGQKLAGGRIVTTRQTTYLVSGTVLSRTGKHPSTVSIASLPAMPNRIPLAVGDTLIITASMEPGHPARYSDTDELTEPARIGCSLGAAIRELHAGERIWFDDGLIGGEIEQVTPSELVVRITQTPPGGARLASEKGINLPDSDLTQPAFTADDREILEFAVEHADLIDYSFVRRVSDITDLLEALRELGGEHLGIVLKIETRRGFEALPELLRAAFVSDKIGVMIARGDLAVECGFARLAEVQEEILWLCEAAHVPAIWATQVLESLAKTGQPSRAEITDAAMGQRAECVMLNKGPEIVAAVRALGDILQRMETHQDKKRTLLRKLNAWG